MLTIHKTFRNTLAMHPGDIAHRIEWALREAREDPAPALHMNADALVIEYNDAGTGHKIFEKICPVSQK